MQRFGTFALTKTIDGPTTGRLHRWHDPGRSPSTTRARSPAGRRRRHPQRHDGPGGVAGRADPRRLGVHVHRDAHHQPGDFVDPSYTWTGSAVSPTTVTIGRQHHGTATITNTYIRQFGSLVITKAVVGDGYLGGAAPNFRVLYSCGTGLPGQRHRRQWRQRDRSAGCRPGCTCTVQEVPPAPGAAVAGVHMGDADVVARRGSDDPRQRLDDGDGEQPDAADLRSGQRHQGDHR